MVPEFLPPVFEMLPRGAYQSQGGYRGGVSLVAYYNHIFMRRF